MSITNYSIRVVRFIYVIYMITSHRKTISPIQQVFPINYSTLYSLANPHAPEPKPYRHTPIRSKTPPAYIMRACASVFSMHARARIVLLIAGQHLYSGSVRRNRARKTSILRQSHEEAIGEMHRRPPAHCAVSCCRRF